MQLDVVDVPAVVAHSQAVGAVEAHDAAVDVLFSVRVRRGRFSVRWDALRESAERSRRGERNERRRDEPVQAGCHVEPSLKVTDCTLHAAEPL
jgi:hypothetical protein